MSEWVNEPFQWWLMPNCLAWILVGPGLTPLILMQLTSDVLACLININIYNWNHTNSDDFLLRKFTLEWIPSQFNSFFNAIQWCSPFTRMAIMKKMENKWWRGCGIHHRGKHRLESWHDLLKLITCLPHDLAVPFLGICPREISACVHQKAYIRLFTRIIFNSSKQKTTHMPIDTGTDEVWSIHTVQKNRTMRMDTLPIM